MAITAEILGGAVQLTGNPAWVRLSGGSAPAGTSDYKLLLKVISEDGKLEGAPFIDAIAPDDSGEALFNISGYVDKPVNALFQYPPSGAVVSYSSLAFNVQVQPGESYIDEDGILQENWFTISDIFQFLKGGSNSRQIAMWEEEESNFYQEYLVNGRFLTPRPWGDFVLPNQPVKLWFMVIENKSATFHVKAVYYDESFYEYSTAVSLNIDYLYEFNCNPVHLGVDLENEEGSKLHFFDVWLESDGSEISDSRRFQYDHRNFERPLYLFYTNSLGGIDDIFFGGFLIEGADIEGNIVYKPQQKSDTRYDPTLIVAGKEGNNTWKLNTGYRATDSMPDLRDMLLSRQAWLVYPNLYQTNYLFTPVIVDPGSFELINRKNHLTQLSIEVKDAHILRFGFDNRIQSFV
jgi:hypothetical protein